MERNPLSGLPARGAPMPIEVTGGLASGRPPFKSAEEMIRASYSAMRQAKRDGDDRLTVARDPHQHETRRLQRREAITANELVLLYQPVVHLLTERVIGAEALVRWDHPDRGMLYPQAFLPLAEETGLIGELDRWVVETALQQAHRWTRPGAEVLLDWISVNVSPQFVESGLLPLAA
jgi:predicted signal transduction protein with EAL and GGDEF domain